MKTGETYHEYGCSCGWCLTGETRFPITEVIAEIGEDRQWIRQNPTYIDGVLERERKIKENIIKLGYDPIQNDCKYGFVFSDRCRYNPRLGCDCGAYPPLKWDGEKYVSP